MKMKHKTEFEFNGDEMTFEDVEQLWTAVQNAGRGCTVTVKQSTYQDYYSSTTTYIEVEAE